MNEAIFGVAVFLLVAGAWKKEMLLLFVSGAFWVIFAVIMYNQSGYPGTGIWDWQFATSFVSFFVAFAAFLYGVTSERKTRREKKEQIAAMKMDTEDYSDILDEDNDGSMAESIRQQEAFDRRMGKPIMSKKKKKRKEDFLEEQRRKYGL